MTAPDRASSWLVRSRRGTGKPDALLPPGSGSPLDLSVRLPHWSRCSWSQADAQPRIDPPDDCDAVGVDAALSEARRWAGHDRWVLQETVDYVHLLLTHVRSSLAHDGELTQAVSRVLADPALDLLGELREIAKDERYTAFLEDEFAKLPLLSSSRVDLDPVERPAAILRDLARPRVV